MTKKMKAPSNIGVGLGIGASALLAMSCNVHRTLGGSTGGTTSVSMYHNDMSRTGQNLDETILNPSNVNSGTFGKIAALPVDGQIYAQPLVAAGVQTSDGTSHNLVIVATEGDSVYAFDEDQATAASNPSTTAIWERHFLSDGFCAASGNVCAPVTPAITHAPNITPVSGITATPVIDQTAGVIYITAMSVENGKVTWKLHALSLTNGQEQSNSPVIIKATAAVGPTLPGAPSPTDFAGNVQNGVIPFQAQYQLSRAGLVLSNGVVYIAFTSWDDLEPDHGWMLGYDGTKLNQVSSFITTPSSGCGTFWMSGGAPAVDESGNLYAATGNGDQAFLGTSSVPDLADSVLKLSLGGSTGLQLADYFTPYNWQALANGDVDLGAGGVLLLPDQPGSHPHVLVAGGKQGTIYLIDRDKMGKYTSGSTSDSQIVQSVVGFIPGGLNRGPGLYGTPSYFNGNVIVMPQANVLTSIPLINGKLVTTNAMKSPVTEELRGSTVSISASDATNSKSDGIVWYIDPSAYTYNGSGTTTTNGPAVLMAFNASDFSQPLYQSSPVESDEAAQGDQNAAGDAVKFTVPTVANGLVFVGTQTELSIYGLKDRPVPTTSPSSDPDASPEASLDNSSRSFASVAGKNIPWLDKLIAEKKTSCSSEF